VAEAYKVGGSGPTVKNGTVEKVEVIVQTGKVDVNEG